MNKNNDNLLPKYPNILQVSTRPWLYGLSLKYNKKISTLESIPDEVLEDIQSKGFDMLWIMGIWSLGTVGLEHDKTEPTRLENYKKLLPDFTLDDVIGSPYSIKEYTANREICPNGDEDIKTFRMKLNKYNIKLMLDFVPNHTSIDSPQTKDNIDYYIRAPKEMKEPYDEKRFLKNGIAFAGIKGIVYWTDVAQLNYWNPKTVRFQIDNLKKVASLCDGIRCDVAQILINDNFGSNWEEELKSWGWTKPEKEFWDIAIKEVKNEFPNTIFLSESYGDVYKELIKEGFDYCYDKDLLDKFVKEDIKVIKEYIEGNKNYNDHLCHFLENHDHNRAMELFKEDANKAKTVGIAVYTVPGMRFFFQDQWLGLKNRLEVQLRRSYKEDGNDAIKEFYSKFFPIIQKKVFKYGQWLSVEIKGKDADKLMSWMWVDKENKENIITVINYNNEKCEGIFTLSPGYEGKEVKDLFTDTVYPINSDKTISLTIDEYGYKLLNYQ